MRYMSEDDVLKCLSIHTDPFLEHSIRKLPTHPELTPEEMTPEMMELVHDDDFILLRRAK